MDCQQLLALLEPEEYDDMPEMVPEESSAGEESDSGPSAAGEALRDPEDLLAMLEDESGPSAAGEPEALGAPEDILALLHDDIYRNSRRRMQKRRVKHNGRLFRKDKKERHVAKQLVAKARRFNASGRAVRQDALITLEGSVPKIKGSTQWKKWLPEAIQKAAFSKGPLRTIVKSMQDGHGPLASQKVSPTTVMQCRSLTAKAIVDGTQKGRKRVAAQSEAQPLDYWITNTMYDEAKLWYKVKGLGFRRFSTLAYHTQCTWRDERGTHDEDVIQPPRAMRRYSASTQWSILSEDTVSGICPIAGSRPSARYYGILSISDSHAVNKLTLKYARQVMPETDLMLASFCLQHHTGNSVASLSEYLNLFTRVWTLSKTFSEGDYHQDLLEKVAELLEDEDEGLEVVDPELFELAPGDLSNSYTNAVVNRCYQRGLELGEDLPENNAKFQQVKEDFLRFFPFGWNRHRVLHLCPAGCCGPSACHSRATSVERACNLIRKVVLKRIVAPAQNKWTKMDPAFNHQGQHFSSK